MSIRPAWVLVVLIGGCGATASGTVLLSVPDVRASPVRVGEWIEGYDLAVASIAAIMERDLALPTVEATLHFYPNHTAFRSALETEGYTPEFARDAAATLSGIGGFRRVLLNDESLRWPQYFRAVAA